MGKSELLSLLLPYKQMPAVTPMNQSTLKYFEILMFKADVCVISQMVQPMAIYIGLVEILIYIINDAFDCR